MDDIKKDVFRVWQLRLGLESIKKKISRIEAMMASDECALAFSETEITALEKNIAYLKRAHASLESKQIKLEEEINLPNPYLNQG